MSSTTRRQEATVLNTIAANPSVKAQTHRLRRATAILAAAIVTAIAAPNSFAATDTNGPTSATGNSTSTTSSTTTERKSGEGSRDYLVVTDQKYPSKCTVTITGSLMTISC